MKGNKYTLGFALFVLVIISVVWKTIKDIPYPADIYPRALLIITAVLAVLLVFKEIFVKSNLKNITLKIRIKSIFGIMVLLMLYLLGMQYIGFYTSSLIFMIIGILFLEKKITKKQVFVAIITSIITILLIFLVFNVFLSIPTPVGILI